VSSMSGVNRNPLDDLNGLQPLPFAGLRDRLLEVAAARERAGDPRSADELRQLLESWGDEQELWMARVRGVLGVHHEINNALVGVRGNLQLVLKDPAGPSPDARQRLEVVLRESNRIQEAAARLRDLKAILGGPIPGSRAA